MVQPAETEERFARVEREYAARERLGMFGLRPRNTVLLYGPSGCGKSLGAKRLAWNSGLPLMKVRFDDLLSFYFGESLSTLRAVFDAAKGQPCVLLLDECDFIARSRSGGMDVGEASRVVNLLLHLMEEFDAAGMLVATTNLEVRRRVRRGPHRRDPGGDDAEALAPTLNGRPPKPPTDPRREGRTVGGFGSRAGVRRWGRHPHFFRLAGGRFAFAGPWVVWRDGEAKLATTCVLTTGANELAAAAHDRMPVIVRPDDQDRWLDPSTPAEELSALSRSFPAEVM